jgi:hypothetical protein
VLITRYTDGFELRIQELLIIVFARNLDHGWKQLAELKRQVIDCATAAGLVDEIPAPGPLPPLIGPNRPRSI